MKRILIAMSAVALLVSVSLARPPRVTRRARGCTPAPAFHRHPQGFLAWFSGCWFHWDNGHWRACPPGHRHGNEHRGDWRHEPRRHREHNGWNQPPRGEERRGRGRHGPPGRP